MVPVKFKVRFYETDMMGVAHHTNHLRWFELGRVEYLRQAGIDLNELMKERILFPIKHISCEYVEPATFDDILILETNMAKVTRAQMNFSYRILRERDGALIAHGTTQNVFTNRDTGKVIRVPEEGFKRLLAFVEADNNAE